MKPSSVPTRASHRGSRARQRNQRSPNLAGTHLHESKHLPRNLQNRPLRAKRREESVGGRRSDSFRERAGSNPVDDNIPMESMRRKQTLRQVRVDADDRDLPAACECEHVARLYLHGRHELPVRVQKVAGREADFLTRARADADEGCARVRGTVRERVHARVYAGGCEHFVTDAQTSNIDHSPASDDARSFRETLPPLSTRPVIRTGLPRTRSNLFSRRPIKRRPIHTQMRKVRVRNVQKLRIYIHPARLIPQRARARDEPRYAARVESPRAAHTGCGLDADEEARVSPEDERRQFKTRRPQLSARLEDFAAGAGASRAVSRHLGSWYIQAGCAAVGDCAGAGGVAARVEGEGFAEEVLRSEVGGCGRDESGDERGDEQQVERPATGL